MFKDENEFGKIVDKLNIDTKSNPVHRQNLKQQMLSVFDETQQKPTTRTIISLEYIRNTIMKSPITKFAAVITVVFFSLFITLFSKTSKPAYAIQQTLDALEKVRHMHVFMYNDQGKITDERWIEIGQDGFQKRYYQRVNMFDMNVLVVDDTNTCSVYYPDKNTVVIYDSNQKQYQWFGNLKGLLIKLAGQGESGEVEIEKNVDYWGIPAHRVRLVELNMDCYIDRETKLPIAVGPSQIDYEELPEDIFSFTTPSGAEVFDMRPGVETTELPDWLQTNDISMEKYKQGKIAIRNRDYFKAIELLTEAVEAQPLNNWAWLWLGQSYYQLGNYDSAVSSYTELVELFKTLSYEAPYCHLARGLAFKAQGMIATAKQDFSVALPVMIKALRNIKESELFDDADFILYRDIPENTIPSDEERFAVMIERLREVTGENFGYAQDSSPEETEEIIKAWEDWWQQNKINYEIVTP